MRHIRLQRFLQRSQTRSEGMHENVMTDIAPCEIIDPPSGGGSSDSGGGSSARAVRRPA
jgi:hypothetical protein